MVLIPAFKFQKFLLVQRNNVHVDYGEAYVFKELTSTVEKTTSQKEEWTTLEENRPEKNCSRSRKVQKILPSNTDLKGSLC